MARSSNQKQKLLHIMKLFEQRTDEDHGLSLAQIIDSLDEAGINAERKSLYDDFEALRIAGYDIEKRQEKNTTVYYIANRTFELAELKLLVDAVQSSKFITRKKSVELIHKIEGFASTYQAQNLQRQVYVSNRIKTMNESIYYTVDQIHAAISGNTQISFQYYAWNEKKEKILRHDGRVYQVSPWALTWDDENYYLIAYDGTAEKIKHYRVDKMLRLRVLTDKREGAQCFRDFDMGIYSKKTFSMFGGREELVRLRCKNSLANVIIDRFGTEITILPSGAEHFEVGERIAISPNFLAWVMAFGDEIEILSPDSVIGELKALTKQVLKHYE